MRGAFTSHGQNRGLIRHARGAVRDLDRRGSQRLAHLADVGDPAKPRHHGARLLEGRIVEQRRDLAVRQRAGRFERPQMRFDPRRDIVREASD